MELLEKLIDVLPSCWPVALLAVSLVFLAAIFVLFLGFFVDGLGTGAWCEDYDATIPLNGWFYDLADLNQSHPYVRAELKRWVRHLVDSYGLSALRLDTTPYMPTDFLSELQVVCAVACSSRRHWW